MTESYITPEEAEAFLVYCEEDVRGNCRCDNYMIFDNGSMIYFYEEACKEALEEFRSVYDGPMVEMWGVNGTVDCPTCNGKGEAEVGLTGFTRRWIAKCPDCNGEGKLYAMEAYTVKQRLDRRRIQGRPKCPPSGCY